MSVALFPVDKIIVGSTAKKKICVLSHKGSVKDLSHKKKYVWGTFISFNQEWYIGSNILRYIKRKQKENGSSFASNGYLKAVVLKMQSYDQ